MSWLRRRWMGLVLLLTGYIHRLKKGMLRYDIVIPTIVFGFWIIVLEIILAVLCLPLYFSKDYAKDPTLFNREGFSYIAYKMRKQVTLSAATTMMVLAVLILFYATFVHAATLTWDAGAGAGDLNWSTCANWTTDTCPGSADSVVFDGTTTTNSIIDSGFAGTLANLTINLGYTGTITPSRTLILTGSGAGSYTQADGAFIGGSSVIDIDGSFSLSGGTFRASSASTTIGVNFTVSGGTFHHNNGALEFDSGNSAEINVATSLTVANLMINKGTDATYMDVAANDTVTVTGTLYLTNGYFGSSGGTIANDSCSVTPHANFDGGDYSTLVSITGGSGTITAGEGTFLPALTLNAASCTLSLSGTATTTFDSQLTLTSGTIAANNAAVDIDGNAGNSTGYTQSGGTYTGSSGAENFDKNFTVSGGTFTSGGGRVMNASASNSDLSGTGSVDFSASDRVDFDVGTFIMSGGTFTASTNTMYMAGAQWDITGGTFNHSNGTIEFDGNQGTQTDVNTSLTLAHVTLNRTGWWGPTNAGDTITVTGTLKLLDGGLRGSGIVAAQGDLWQSNTDRVSDGYPSDGNLQFTGTANQTLYGWATPTSGDLPSITINKTGGTLTYGGGSTSSTFRMDFSDFTYTAGTVDPSSSTFYFDGSGTGQSIKTIDGQGSSATSSFDNVQFVADIFQLGGVLEVRGDLVIASGTLRTQANGIHLYGGWTFTSGTFTHGDGTVFFDGVNQIITGSTTFYGLTKSTTTQATTLTFPAGVTTTMQGTMNLVGSSGKLLSLRSSTNGTQTYINPIGARSISYLDVKDNNNINSTAIAAGSTNTTDSGNNTNWTFDNPTWSGLSVVAVLDGTGTVSTTITVDDPQDDNVRLKVQYQADSCSGGSPTAATVSTTVYTAAGTATVDNSGAYQITGVSTASGANTVTLYWRSKSDKPTANGTYCVYVTPSDGSVDATTVASTTVTVDNVAPTRPGNLTLSSIGTSSITPAYGTKSGDTNFDEYIIYYKAGASGVTTTDSAFTSSSDANLANVNFNSATTFTISSLSVNTQYVMNIWAYDTYANNIAALTELAKYTAAAVPASVSASVGGTNSATVSWNANGNPSGTAYYVDDTGGAVNSGWITNSSHTFTNLSADTSYTFRVKARNGDQTETATVSATAVTTQSAGGGTAPGAASGASPFTPVPRPATEEPKDVAAVTINSGDSETTSREITVALSAPRATEIAVSERADFSDAVFAPYVTSLSYRLSAGDGVKIVYVRFRSSAGVTEDRSDSITLRAEDIITPSSSEKKKEVQSSGEEDSTTALVDKKTTGSGETDSSGGGGGTVQSDEQPLTSTNLAGNYDPVFAPGVTTIDPVIDVESVGCNQEQSIQPARPADRPVRSFIVREGAGDQFIHGFSGGQIILRTDASDPDVGPGYRLALRVGELYYPFIYNKECNHYLLAVPLQINWTGAATFAVRAQTPANNSFNLLVTVVAETYGRVINSQTGRAVRNASVTARGASDRDLQPVTVITDNDGRYGYFVPPAGENQYRLAVSRADYITREAAGAVKAVGLLSEDLTVRQTVNLSDRDRDGVGDLDDFCDANSTVHIGGVTVGGTPGIDTPSGTIVDPGNGCPMVEFDATSVSLPPGYITSRQVTYLADGSRPAERFEVLNRHGRIAVGLLPGEWFLDWPSDEIAFSVSPAGKLTWRKDLEPIFAVAYDQKGSHLTLYGFPLRLDAENINPRSSLRIIALGGAAAPLEAFNELRLYPRVYFIQSFYYPRFRVGLDGSISWLPLFNEVFTYTPESATLTVSGVPVCAAKVRGATPYRYVVRHGWLTFDVLRTQTEYRILPTVPNTFGASTDDPALINPSLPFTIDPRWYYEQPYLYLTQGAPYKSNVVVRLDPVRLLDYADGKEGDRVTVDLGSEQVRVSLGQCDALPPGERQCERGETVRPAANGLAEIRRVSVAVGRDVYAQAAARELIVGILEDNTMAVSIPGEPRDIATCSDWNRPVEERLCDVDINNQAWQEIYYVTLTDAPINNWFVNDRQCRQRAFGIPLRVGERVIETEPGRVIDSETGDSVSDVRVALLSEAGESIVGGVLSTEQVASPNGEYIFLVPDGTYRLEVRADGYVTEQTSSFTVRNGAVNRIVALRPLAERVIAATPPGGDDDTIKVKPVVVKLSAQIRRAAAVVTEFADDPKVEQVAQNIVAPAAVGLSVATVAVSLWGNLWALLQYLFLQPLLLLRAKERKAWGVVYNSMNKLPVDLAIVRLVEVEHNRLVQSRVTDQNGRYVFQAPAGAYRIEVRKPGFVFPSHLLRDVRADGRRLDLYHGDTLAVAEEGRMVTPNIPLDPPGAEQKTPARIVRQLLFVRAQHGAAMAGIATTAAAFAINPSPQVAGFLAGHLALLAVFHRFALPRSPKRHGQVVDARTDQPLKGVAIRLFTRQYDKLVDTQVTGAKGQYAFLVGPSQYYVRVEYPAYEIYMSPPIVFEEAEQAFIVKDIRLRPSRAE